MSHNLRFENNYVEEIYKKRKQITKLQEEIDIEINDIKSQLRKNGMLYASTDKFTLYLKHRYTANQMFIKLLEDKNMIQYITKSVTAKDFEDAVSVLNLNELGRYRDMSCEMLYINKKR